MALVPKSRTPIAGGLLAILLVLAFSLTARAEPAVATYYGGDYAGAPTASGELYDPNGYTAAHPYLPFGTELLVSHAGRSVIVRVNDSCFCELDLSFAAAQAIGLVDVGVAVVDVEVLGSQAVPPPPADAALEAEMPPAGAAPEFETPPADAAPEVEMSQALDGPLIVEDQSGSTVAPEAEAPLAPPVDYSGSTPL